jgi:hypothetical protein
VDDQASTKVENTGRVLRSGPLSRRHVTFTFFRRFRPALLPRDQTDLPREATEITNLSC